MTYMGLYTGAPSVTVTRSYVTERRIGYHSHTSTCMLCTQHCLFCLIRHIARNVVNVNFLIQNTD